ncbi:MAG TPA: hypothetical protein VH255_02430 [Verrucomicrobiae bacterium]|jgi:hypothetical protein|nr:hypothetical protein [Verrucomicrobiae bacterium]
MDDAVPFASKVWFITFAILLFARGMDFLSTWVATPRLVLEGNPIAKKLGWKWGIPFNLAICVIAAFWPAPSLIISTTSVLVASRNFQHAWLMRSMGEAAYRDWFVARLRETPLALYLLCLFGQTFLTALVGAAVFYFAGYHAPLQAIGTGIIGYSLAVLFFTLLALWRMRHTLRKSPDRLD